MTYRFGDYELDTQLFELRFAGMPLKPEPKVFDLLDYLTRHHERVVTKQELFAHLWPAQFISEAVLNYCIMAARKGTGDSGHRQGVIKTVRGRGYCFVAVLEARVADTPGSIGAMAREALIHVESQPQAPDEHAAVRMGGTGGASVAAVGRRAHAGPGSSLLSRGRQWGYGASDRRPRLCVRLRRPYHLSHSTAPWT